MDDRPQDRPEDRRRRGPLGDEEDAAETTRGIPRDSEDAATRRIAPEDTERGTSADSPTAETSRTSGLGGEDPDTRVIRTPSAHEDEAPYPSGYPDAPEYREARLREAYGGVDWLASFIGSVFALVGGGILLSFSGLALGYLGFTLNFESRQMDTAMIVGLVLIGLALFLAYFCGGYVAGRLSRFDGGRNGAATVLWGTLLSFILALFGSLLLPGSLSELLQEFVRSSVQPAISGLTDAGLVGAGIVVAALLLELLGGFLGGRLGNSYHTRIDETI